MYSIHFFSTLRTRVGRSTIAKTVCEWKRLRPCRDPLDNLTRKARNLGRVMMETKTRSPSYIEQETSVCGQLWDKYSITVRKLARFKLNRLEIMREA